MGWLNKKLMIERNPYTDIQENDFADLYPC